MDEQAFDEFYAASFPRVTRQVYAMIGDRDEAQECVQEAFVRAWAHRRKLDRADHPEAWVRTTAYRLAVSRWRRIQRARRPARPGATGVPATTFAAHDPAVPLAKHSAHLTARADDRPLPWTCRGHSRHRLEPLT